MLPNQGSNLDFTDPESVVLPITPLGISDRKITHIFYSCDKNFVFFLTIWYSLTCQADSPYFCISEATSG